MSEGITDFEGRTAFVTGGARGIGLGIVRALLRRGANVAIADISADALGGAADALGLPRSGSGAIGSTSPTACSTPRWRPGRRRTSAR